MRKKLLCMMTTVALIMSLCFTMSGCGGSEGDGEKITVVQQYGMAYAPFQIMEQQKLIEKHYGKEIEVEYTQLNSGASINDSFMSGDVQVGAMGVAPAITGTLTGVGYKICSNMSAQPHKIMTNDSSLKTLNDIGKKDQIALVNIGSIQHILLAMACENQLGDAHSLDNNIVAMSHPDGMAALINGSVKSQVTTSPYVFKEAEEGMTEIDAISEVWPEGNSFIVAVASEDLYENNPDLYNAVVAAIAEACEFLTENKEEAAEILCVNEDVDKETMLKWLNDSACSYSTELKGVMEMAKFMSRSGFLEVDGPSSIKDLAYDNVKGE